jgi:hypothetical protein
VKCLAKPLHTKQQQNVWQTIGETLLNNHWLGNRGGSFSFLVEIISNVLVMEIGWTNVIYETWTNTTVIFRTKVA